MSHDSHASAASDSGPGIIDTVSGWATPEGAESSTTVFKMVGNLTGNTVRAIRALLALSVAGTTSLATGAVTMANKSTFGAAYITVNKAAQLGNDLAGKSFEYISGNKA